MERDDAIRKVRSLQAVAANKGATADEAETAAAMAKKFIDRFDIEIDEILEEAPTPGLFDVNFDGLYTSMGMTATEIQEMKRDAARRWDEFQRIRKEAVAAIYRIQGFLSDEDNGHFRNQDAYDDINKQLRFAKGQLKVCIWCHKKGFGPEGSTQRYALGKTKTGRDRYHEFHPSCWTAANEFWDRQTEKQRNNEQ